MSKIIKVRRGLRSELEAISPLALAEIGYITDEERIVIGGVSGNVNIPAFNDVLFSPEQEGAKDDGSDSYEAFLALILKGIKTIRIDKEFTIDTSIDLSDIELVFYEGGKIIVNSPRTVKVGVVRSGLIQIFDGDGFVEFSKNTFQVYPEWFGAKGDLSVDDSLIIQKTHDSCETNSVTVVFSKNYGITNVLTWSRKVPIFSTSNSSIESYGGGTQGIVLENGNYTGKNILPIINGFPDFGLKLAGTNLTNLFIPVISNCGSALILECIGATHSFLLDSNIEIQQIGLCTNGIVIKADTVGCTMQGNEIKCNFITTTKYSVLFEDNGLVSSPNWDSNKIIIQAIDPTTSITDAIMIYNPNSYAVNRWTISCESWCGGLAPTAKVIQGGFDDLRLFINPAQSFVDLQIQVGGTGNSLNFSDTFGKVNASIETPQIPNQKGVFNGGTPVYANKVKLKATLAGDIPNGSFLVLYAYHQCTDGNSDNFSVTMSNNEGSGFGLQVDGVEDVSLTNDDEIKIILRNYSGQTIPNGSVIYMNLWNNVF